MPFTKSVPLTQVNAVYPDAKPQARDLIAFLHDNGPIHARTDLVTETGHVRRPRIDFPSQMPGTNPQLVRKLWNRGLLYVEQEGFRYLYIDLSDATKKGLAQAAKDWPGQPFAHPEVVDVPPAEPKKRTVKISRTLADTLREARESNGQVQAASLADRVRARLAEKDARIAELEAELAEVYVLLEDLTEPAP